MLKPALDGQIGRIGPIFGRLQCPARGPDNWLAQGTRQYKGRQCRHVVGAGQMHDIRPMDRRRQTGQKAGRHAIARNAVSIMHRIR